MMSTLSSNLLSLKSSPAAAPPSPPQAGVPPSKRFANIMAKVQATTPQTAPAAAPAPAKPTAPDNGAPAGPHSEASRAEANARNNAKAAARAVAARALVKAPGSDVNRKTEPQVEPHTEPHTEPHIEPHQAAADGKSSAEGAALSTDMAAWLAALNPALMNSAAAANSPPDGDAAITEAELATQLATLGVGQVVADKNTQILREEAQADKDGDAQHGSHHGVAGQRTATDTSRSRAASDGSASDGAGSSGRDGQRSASREAREAVEARATSRTSTDLPANMSANNTSANVMTMLSKEVTAASTTTATSATDFSALMASNMNATNGTSTTPDTLTLSLPTPVNAPAFREALGVQVSLLARDGVQTAELHLNPAEMGPVSIQIVMEGNQARVDFGADVAATRAAIEAGMPELASALLDAGFTLAGGGVSQHAKGQDTADSENRQGQGRRNFVATASGLATAAAPVPQQRVSLTPGGVDLFA
jgi:flagellar hook-length control protein FliK